MIRRNARKKAAKARKSRRAKKTSGRARPVIIISKSGISAPKRSRYLKKGMRINPKKRRHTRRHARRNPGIDIKALISKQNLMNVGSIGLGLVGGAVGMSLVSRVGGKFAAEQDKFLGVAHILLGFLVAGIFRKSAIAKAAGATIAGAGAYDLIASNTDWGLPVLPRNMALVDKMLPPPAATQGMNYQLGLSYSPSYQGMNYAPGAIMGVDDPLKDLLN